MWYIHIGTCQAFIDCFSLTEKLNSNDHITIYLGLGCFPDTATHAFFKNEWAVDNHCISYAVSLLRLKNSFLPKLESVKYRLIRVSHLETWCIIWLVNPLSHWLVWTNYAIIFFHIHTNVVCFKIILLLVIQSKVPLDIHWASKETSLLQGDVH